jgi:hypothetical protein
MAAAIIRRSVDNVTLAGETAKSTRPVLRYLCSPELVRADVREQTRAVRLPDCVITYWRLSAASEVLP